MYYLTIASSKLIELVLPDFSCTGTPDQMALLGCQVTMQSLIGDRLLEYIGMDPPPKYVSLYKYRCAVQYCRKYHIVTYFAAHDITYKAVCSVVCRVLRQMTDRLTGRAGISLTRTQAASSRVCGKPLPGV